MKSLTACESADGHGSLPVRGAWVEIKEVGFCEAIKPCRSPCGERGLKSQRLSRRLKLCPSLPVRGAWVEILSALEKETGIVLSLPVRGAWVEIIAGARTMPTR